MRTANLTEFIDRGSLYEVDWRANLDPQLRRFTIWSGVSLGGMLLALTTLPPWLPYWYTLQPFLLGLNLVGLVAYVLLLLATKGLQSGRLAWHWVAIGEVGLGAINTFAISVSLLIGLIMLIIQAVIFIFQFILGLVFLVILLGMMFGR